MAVFVAKLLEIRNHKGDELIKRRFSGELFGQLQSFFVRFAFDDDVTRLERPHTTLELGASTGAVSCNIQSMTSL